MKKQRAPKIAIVCAYRSPEDDLAATIEAAGQSAGKTAKVYAVEDRDHTGPGQNRHRGIEAACDAEVIIIIDAHMRFQNDVLRQMALQVKRRGGLLDALCHHNESCSFEDQKPPYAGARIVYRAKDGNEFKPLDAKWSRDTRPGSRPCVMGACYAFRRDWYYDVGQPLSILTGWGCDEQVLSIAAWLSGHTPETIDGHVAHRWRPRPPWAPDAADIARVGASRTAMVQAIVTDAWHRRVLLEWSGLKDVKPFINPATERFHAALLKQKRSFRQWLAFMCEPDEFDGVQQEYRPKAPQQLKQIHLRAPTPVVVREGVKCPHCATIHDPMNMPPVLNTYPNGNRRHGCTVCGNPFISHFNVPACVK